MCLIKRLSIGLLLAMFVLMQIGTITHEISHVQTQTDNPVLASSQQNSPQQDKNTTHEHCAQCLAHAQADVAMVVGVLHIALELTSYFVSTAYIAYLFIVIPSAYLARAPPFLR